MLEAARVPNYEHYYPPKDAYTFKKLCHAIWSAEWDTMRKDCIIYYLLKWWGDGREVKFRKTKCIPPQFSALADAYYSLDIGDPKVRSK